MTGLNVRERQCRCCLCSSAEQHVVIGRALQQAREDAARILMQRQCAARVGGLAKDAADVVITGPQVHLRTRLAWDRIGQPFPDVQRLAIARQRRSRVAEIRGIGPTEDIPELVVRLRQLALKWNVVRLFCSKAVEVFERASQ